MTLAEATDWMAHAVATSTVLSKLFGVQFAFGELSAYQRQRCRPFVYLSSGC